MTDDFKNHPSNKVVKKLGLTMSQIAEAMDEDRKTIYLAYEKKPKRFWAFAIFTYLIVNKENALQQLTTLVSLVKGFEKDFSKTIKNIERLK